jgi:hypothetical protein
MVISSNPHKEGGEVIERGFLGGGPLGAGCGDRDATGSEQAKPASKGRVVVH